MSISTIIKPTFKDAQRLKSFYYTIESKNNLYNELVKRIDSNYIESLSDLNIHEIYNYILMKYYPDETSIKSNFINHMLLKGKSHVTIFELPVISSRADLCKINGKSIVYEIKTDLDNLNRLSKQLGDYSKIFDKTFVICSCKKLTKIMNCTPVGFGVFSYRTTKEGRYIFKLERNALQSNVLDSREQLRILRKSELKKLVPLNEISTRNQMIEYLLQTNDEKQINRTFKNVLKNRYHIQWDFFKHNHNEILEIDYQWFFKNPINPKTIYS